MIKKWIKIVIITQIIVVALLGMYMLLTGFYRMSDAYIGEYTVAEDGGEITIEVGVAGSIGYIRNVAVNKQEDGIMYLDCYAAFGGINGKIGARGEYSFLLEKDTDTIALYRSDNRYEIILEKDNEGNWNRVDFGQYIDLR